MTEAVPVKQPVVFENVSSRTADDLEVDDVCMSACVCCLGGMDAHVSSGIWARHGSAGL